MIQNLVGRHPDMVLPAWMGAGNDGFHAAPLATSMKTSGFMNGPTWGTSLFHGPGDAARTMLAGLDMLTELPSIVVSISRALGTGAGKVTSTGDRS